MEHLLGILINSAIGGGGGFLGNLIKKNGMSLLMNIVAGAVGGNLGNVVGGLLNVLGDSDLSIGSILSSLLGGGLGSFVGGLLSKKQS
jgi:uncharacterized membrane protein YeaQ/YmgE (transglycosylase-associated protein family)